MAPRSARALQCRPPPATQPVVGSYLPPFSWPPPGHHGAKMPQSSHTLYARPSGKAIRPDQHTEKRSLASREGSAESERDQGGVKAYWRLKGSQVTRLPCCRRLVWPCRGRRRRRGSIPGGLFHPRGSWRRPIGDGRPGRDVVPFEGMCFDAATYLLGHPQGLLFGEVRENALVLVAAEAGGASPSLLHAWRR